MNAGMEVEMRKTKAIRVKYFRGSPYKPVADERSFSAPDLLLILSPKWLQCPLSRYPPQFCKICLKCNRSTSKRETCENEGTSSGGRLKGAWKYLRRGCGRRGEEVGRSGARGESSGSKINKNIIRRRASDESSSRNKPGN